MKKASSAPAQADRACCVCGASGAWWTALSCSHDLCLKCFKGILPFSEDSSFRPVVVCGMCFAEDDSVLKPYRKMDVSRRPSLPPIEESDESNPVKDSPCPTPIDHISKAEPMALGKIVLLPKATRKRRWEETSQDHEIANADPKGHMPSTCPYTPRPCTCNSCKQTQHRRSLYSAAVSTPTVNLCNSIGCSRRRFSSGAKLGIDSISGSSSSSSSSRRRSIFSSGTAAGARRNIESMSVDTPGSISNCRKVVCSNKDVRNMNTVWGMPILGSLGENAAHKSSSMDSGISSMTSGRSAAQRGSSLMSVIDEEDNKVHEDCNYRHLMSMDGFNLNHAAWPSFTQTDALDFAPMDFPSTYDFDAAVSGCLARHFLYQFQDIVVDDEGVGTKSFWPAGLVNLGNTCFLNCALQCLFFLHPFRKNLLELDLNTTTKDKENICRSVRLSRPTTRSLVSRGEISLYTALQESKFLTRELQAMMRVMASGRKTIVPENFHYAVSLSLPDFGTYQQQDAAEFLLLLIDQVRTEAGHSKLRDVFLGSQMTEILCLSCRQQLSMEDVFTNIYVEFPGREQDITECNLRDLLRKEFEPELYDEVCSVCEKETGIQRKISLTKMPEILQLHLRRFRRTVTGETEKIRVHVRFEEFLPLEEEVYILSGLIEHQGHVDETGHFVAYARALSSTEDSWWYLDDHKVSRVYWEDVARVQAYVLLYSIFLPDPVP